jgi:hypothetical protein
MNGKSEIGFEFRNNKNRSQRNLKAALTTKPIMLHSILKPRTGGIITSKNIRKKEMIAYTRIICPCFLTRYMYSTKLAGEEIRIYMSRYFRDGISEPFRRNPEMEFSKSKIKTTANPENARSR